MLYTILDKLGLTSPLPPRDLQIQKEKQNTLKVMEFAKKHFLAPYQDGGWLQKATRNINGTLYVVYRFNHGLAHSLRQGALAKDILDTLLTLKSKYQKLDSPDLEELANWAIKKDANFFHKVEFASSFQRSGRQSEVASSADMEKYKRYERQDAVNFRKAALSSGLFKDQKEIKIFEEAILWENKGELKEELIPDLKYLRRIFHSAHMFDLRRIPEFDPVRIRQTGMQQLLGHTKSVRKTTHTHFLEKTLWKRSGHYLSATGDRDLTSRSSLDDKFFFQTTHPKIMVDAIYKVRTQTLSPDSDKRGKETITEI